MPDPRSPLHLVLGDVAAGSLKAVTAAGGVPGSVFCIPDDLSHGPLDDGVTRMDHMRRLHASYGPWTERERDLFSPWRRLLARLDADRPDALAIWSGENVSEETFLAMACWWLSGRAVPLLRVAATGGGDRPYVAVHAPDELAGLWATRRVLGDDERRALVLEFERIRDTAGAVRRWEGGRIVGVPSDAYDRLLLAACGDEWRPAMRVVGAAMAACDGPNAMSDLFFASRIHALVEKGTLGEEGSQDRLANRSVRLARAGLPRALDR